MSRLSSKAARIVALCTPLALLPHTAKADDPLNAGGVMKKMNTDERFMFVAGIVEGLAMARYREDGKNVSSMKCIYDWFYKNPEVSTTIYDTFNRMPEYPPGTIVDVLSRKACP